MESFCDNGLNISYNENFYESEKADLIFEQLEKLSFKEIQLKIGSKLYTPLRKVCAFSDDGLSYKFSGTTVTGENWTPLLRRLKEDVESKVGTQFNYALVSFYENGLAKISAHMDNEKDLDPDAPIVALSFGAKRNLIFQRTGFPSVTLPVEHGSLYAMNPPTNKLWKHLIPAEQDVQEPRISITFRKIKLLESPTKKRKLQGDEDDIPADDWLGRCLEKDNAVFHIEPPSYFELSEDVKCSVKEFNGNLRVDIRRYKRLNGRWIPTKEGVVINPLTWYYFCEKIYGFNFVYKSSSFILNNCLLGLNTGDSLHLQHVEGRPNDSLCIKETFISLNQSEVSELRELEREITECLIERLWISLLPRKISSVCQNFPSHSCDKDEILSSYAKCLEKNIALEIKNVYICQGCICDSPSQLNHDCLYQTNKNKFESLGERAWLLLNINELLKDLSEIPSLNFDVVKKLTMDDYKRLLFVHDTSYF